MDPATNLCVMHVSDNIGFVHVSIWVVCFQCITSLILSTLCTASDAVIKISYDPTDEMNYLTVEMDPRNGTFNSSTKLKTNYETNAAIRLYPEVQSLVRHDVAINVPQKFESSSTEVKSQQSLPKPHRIIDKLSELTNMKLRNAASAKFGNLGVQTISDTPDLTSTHKLNKFQNIIANSEVSNDYAIPRSAYPRNSANFTLSIGNTENVQLLHINSNISSLEGYLNQNPVTNSSDFKISSTTATPANLNVSTSESENREHIIQESRVITADQIGMNRPTRVPFHFTTTPPPPVTSTKGKEIPLFRYQKVSSPHNHIFAPTQDPINIAHGEDVNGDDLQDFHEAHLTFGTKVGSVIPTIPDTKQISPLKKIYGVTDNKVSTPQNFRDKAGFPTLSKQSVNLSSATGHNSLQRKSNNINDQLPFFKEQGGIFEHQQINSQIEPNEIKLREKISGVTYASKGPSAKSQTNVYSSPKQPQPLHTFHPPTPEFIRIPQQLYLAPVPVQQTMQPYNPIPISTLYNQHSPAKPIQVPMYYANPALPHPHINIQQNPTAPIAPQFITQNGEILHGNVNYRHTSIEPIQRPRNSDAKNLYYSPSRNSQDPYLHEHGRPPSRGDPESDTFYGSPISLPPKPLLANQKSSKTAQLKNIHSEQRIRDYDEHRYSETPSPEISKPRQRLDPSASPVRRGEPITLNRGNRNYDLGNYENNDETHSGRPPAGGRKFQNYDRPDSFYHSPEHYDFRRSSNPKPNFEYPHVHLGNRNSEQIGNVNRPTVGRNRLSYGVEGSGIEHAAAEDSRERNFPVLDPIYTRTIKQYDQERLKPEQSLENDHNDDEYDDDDQQARLQSNPNNSRGLQAYQDSAHRQDDDEASQNEEEDDDGKPNPQQQQQREEEEPAEEEEETQETPSKQTSDEEEQEDEEQEEPKKQQRGQKKPPKKPKDEKSGNLDDDIDGIEREFGNFGN